VRNEIWALDMGYTNYLLAQQKLVFKQRSGSKVTKRFDQAATPFARTMARREVSETDWVRLEETMGVAGEAASGRIVGCRGGPGERPDSQLAGLDAYPSRWVECHAHAEATISSSPERAFQLRISFAMRVSE
jgi:hypothetical protein